MATTITVQNPLRSRSWGWGYSTTPQRNSTEIVAPNRPEHTGTFGQVQSAIRSDRTFQSFLSGGTYVCGAWFFKGKRVIRVNDGMHWMTMSEAIDYGVFEEFSGTLTAITLEVAE